MIVPRVGALLALAAEALVEEVEWEPQGNAAIEEVPGRAPVSCVVWTEIYALIYSTKMNRAKIITEALKCGSIEMY